MSVLCVWESRKGVGCDFYTSMAREPKQILTSKYKYISLRDFLVFSLTHTYSPANTSFPKKSKRKNNKGRKFSNFYLH